MVRIYLTFLLFSFACAGNVNAGGLFGDTLKALGNASGFRPMVDLGESLDAEHRRFKEDNPTYKQLEEEVTRFVNLPGRAACVQAFESIVQPVKLTCNGFVSQAGAVAEQRFIDEAQQLLVNANIFHASAFNGIRISWCQGDFLGDGITPNSEEIILNRSLQGDPWKIASTIAHEMKHIEQFRRMGTDSFKCDYAIKFAGCLCQDSRHSLENEAYQYEAIVWERLIDDSPQTRQGLARFLEDRVPELQRTAVEAAPTVQIDTRQERWAKRGATKSCTIEGAIPPKMVYECVDNLTEVFLDIAEAIDEDPDRNQNHRFREHVFDRASEVREVCKSVSLPAKLWNRSENDNFRCNMIARSVLRKKAYNID